MRFLPVNLHSVLIELASLDETLMLYQALQIAALPEITEMVPAARTLLIRVKRTELRLPLVQKIHRLNLQRGAARCQQRVVIPVCYNGEDLGAVAEFYGSSVQALISHHQQTRWKVAFIGFAPGFAYLVSEEQASCTPQGDKPPLQRQRWQTPRRDTPRPRIPPGSVALAGEFSGIYPQSSPGGWQLIGQTAYRMWDTARTPAALLQPGMEVQFVDENSTQRMISLPDKLLSGRMTYTDTISANDTVSVKTAPETNHDIVKNNKLTIASYYQPVAPSQDGVLFTVIKPGLQTSWQDDGRIGYAVMGIAAAGAMDKTAWQNANWLVGNPATTPCLEITQGGFHIRAQQDMVLAISGAPCCIRLISNNHYSYKVTFSTPFSVAAGDEIIIEAPVRGVRSYLAIRGGADVAQFLGSVAWDSLAGVGMPPLQAGDVICAGSGLTLTSVQPALPLEAVLPAKGDVVTLDVIAGPRTDWFDTQGLQLLTSQAWQVTPASNRIGLRLNGQQTLTRSQTAELPSEGTCSGAIQVPASGQPVLFLRDHPLTGGYPVIATVADYHLDLAGQIPVTAWLRFNLIVPFQEIAGDFH